MKEKAYMRRFLRNTLEVYAESKGFRLSDKSEKVMDSIIKNEGNCPCRAIAFTCPCPFHVNEVEDDGKCHCNLFVRGDE
jgi:ferredoxin-thioredoxin reductase catalytic subunit